MKPDWCDEKTWADAVYISSYVDCSNAEFKKLTPKIARALLAARNQGRDEGLEEAAAWHRKNARICREIAKDDPRINEADRKRAGQAAIQHDASATGIERLAQAALRKSQGERADD